MVETCIRNVWETCKRRTWTNKLSVLGLSMLGMVGIMLAEALWLGTPPTDENEKEAAPETASFPLTSW